MKIHPYQLHAIEQIKRQAKKPRPIYYVGGERRARNRRDNPSRVFEMRSSNGLKMCRITEWYQDSVSVVYVTSAKAHRTSWHGSYGLARYHAMQHVGTDSWSNEIKINN